MLGTGLDTKVKRNKVWPLHSNNSESIKEDKHVKTYFAWTELRTTKDKLHSLSLMVNSNLIVKV